MRLRQVFSKTLMKKLLKADHTSVLTSARYQQFTTALNNLGSAESSQNAGQQERRKTGVQQFFRVPGLPGYNKVKK